MAFEVLREAGGGNVTLGGALGLELDPALLARFPEGYRHLAYVQVQIGYPVKDDMPGLTGPAVEELYTRGAAWLAGAD